MRGRRWRHDAAGPRKRKSVCPRNKYLCRLLQFNIYTDQVQFNKLNRQIELNKINRFEWSYTIVRCLLAIFTFCKKILEQTGTKNKLGRTYISYITYVCTIWNTAKIPVQRKATITIDFFILDQFTSSLYILWRFDSNLDEWWIKFSSYESLWESL